MSLRNGRVDHQTHVIFARFGWILVRLFRCSQNRQRRTLEIRAAQTYHEVRTADYTRVDVIEFASFLFFVIRPPREQVIVSGFIQHFLDPFGHRGICVTKSASAGILGESIQAVLRSGNLADACAEGQALCIDWPGIRHVERFADNSPSVQRVDDHAGTSGGVCDSFDAAAGASLLIV